ncbi:MAG: 50S ribosome-binding GTPase [Silicimonas sp.]|jgi:hypothetical protein|nr:50S ribosome-binding GTPase [Silicimonas sp.]
MSEQIMDGMEQMPADAVEDVAETRKNRPRVALMGEFSAGKSTLSNLLLGRAALPVNVTATQLPPVWMSFGDKPAYGVGMDGEEFDVDAKFNGVSVHDTRYIRLFHAAKFLQNCDLIDMPGISDPNMDAAVWQRVIGEADIVIWCSHATQAWRQSEAAVWSTMPPELYHKSLLLLTRMDRILSERDRARVVKRVQSETKGLFRAVLPVSLIQALDSRDNPDLWQQSGADVLVKSLIELTDEVASGSIGRRVSRMTRVSETLARPGLDDAIGERVVEKAPKIVMPTRVRPRPLVSRPPQRN